MEQKKKEIVGFIKYVKNSIQEMEFYGKADPALILDYKFKLKILRQNIAGNTNYLKKIISINKMYFQTVSLMQVKSTVLHEIAHAITPGNGHNIIFKIVYRRLLRAFNVPETWADRHMNAHIEELKNF